MARTPRQRGRGGGRLAYLLYLIVRTVIRLLPHAIAGRIGRGLGHLAWWLDRRHRRVVLDNLELALPELEEARKKEIARGCFAHFGFAVFDTISAARFDAAAYLDRCRVEGREHLEAAAAEGKGLLILSAHLGCWEAALQWFTAGYKPIVVIYRPLDNPFLDAELKAQRERFGARSVPKRSAAREGLRSLRQGGQVGILVDQRVHPKDGDPLPFFAHPAYTSPLPAQLALRTDTPVLPIFALPDGSRGYRIVIREAILPASVAGEQNPEQALTQRCLDVTEAEIRAAPQLWLWMHRRWRVNPSHTLRGRARKRQGL